MTKWLLLVIFNHPRLSLVAVLVLFLLFMIGISLLERKLVPEKFAQRPSEPLKTKEANIVVPEPQNVSERLYASDRELLKQILNKHGVLTHEGWEFITPELIEDLEDWKNNG